MSDTRASFEGTFQWIWDSTSLKAADRCPRYYQYTILEGWEHPLPSVHLWFGGLYASALEHYHKHRAAGDDLDTALRKVVLEALVESWNHERDAEGNRVPDTGSPARFDHNTKSRETLIRTIIWYVDTYAEDHFSTYITAEGKPAVEHSFLIPVDGDLAFSGHIDRLCVDPESNIFVHDQKTTGSTIGPYYWKGFKPDIQFSMYTFAGKTVYHLPVKGVVIDAAQIAVGFTRYGRSPILFTEDELDEWYGEMQDLIRRIHGYAEAGYFPRRTTSCSLYGGCPFQSVCSRPTSVRENFLHADFRKRESLWDPAKPRE